MPYAETSPDSYAANTSASDILDGSTVVFYINSLTGGGRGGSAQTGVALAHGRHGRVWFCERLEVTPRAC